MVIPVFVTIRLMSLVIKQMLWPIARLVCCFSIPSVTGSIPAQSKNFLLWYENCMGHQGFFLLGYENCTGHQGFSQSTPASSLSLKIIQDATNFTFFYNLFPFQFHNSNPPAFTPCVCLVVLVVCL